MEGHLPCPSFLGLFVSLVYCSCWEIPWVFESFLLFSRVLKGSHGEDNPWCFGGFSLVFLPKDQGMEGHSGEGICYMSIPEITLRIFSGYF